MTLDSSVSKGNIWAASYCHSFPSTASPRQQQVTYNVTQNASIVFYLLQNRLNQHVLSETNMQGGMPKTTASSYGLLYNWVIFDMDLNEMCV